MRYRFLCPGCESTHATEVPKHSVPYMWRCQKEECGWVMTIQTDAYGITVGWNAPLKKPLLELVK